MAFKNALKMLISKFGLMWVLLLYMIITAVILVSLSLPFAVPALKALRNDGVGKLLKAFLSGITAGDSISVWFDKAYALIVAIKNSFIHNKTFALNTGVLVIVVYIFAYRFIFGLYELPLSSILEGAMSSNARLGFTGRFVSNLGKSSKYVLVKMLYTMIVDALICFIVYWLFVLCASVSVLKIFAPFIIMTVFLILVAFRYSFISMWAPHITVCDGKIFRSFGFSVKRVAKNMGSVFSSFLVSWVLIIAINILIGLFTFGAGLIITVPLCLLFVNLLNMTVYYGKNGKRYYVDANTVVTPPILTDEDNPSDK